MTVLQEKHYESYLCAQVVLVSATLPHEVLEMTHKFMSEPVRVLVKRDELTLEVIQRHCHHFLRGTAWSVNLASNGRQNSTESGP